MKAKLSSAPISYKKMRIVADLIRGRRVSEVSNKLKLMPKKSAQIMKKLIDSAVANAESNSSQKKEDLVIDKIVVNKGTVSRRWRPISRGRAHPYAKQTSVVYLTLKTDIADTPAKKTVKKTTAKKTTKKEDTAKKAEPKTAKKAEPKKAEVKKEEDKSTTKKESK